MAVLIDTASAIRLPSQFVRLVDAVVAANAHDETDWLEWKSDLDLTSADSLGNIARHILAFANRDPDRAAATCEGYAYLVVGAEPGAVIGVSSVDPAKLEGKIGRFLGGDGPSWSPHYVDMDGGLTVAVFAVTPPRWGDRIHLLETGFGKYNSGAVFVRRTGATHLASAAETRMLQRRLLKRRERIQVSLEWASDPPPLAFLDLSKDAVEEWIEAERTSVLATDGAAAAISKESPHASSSAATADRSPAARSSVEGTQEPEPARVRAFDLGRSEGGPTFNDIVELERRKDSGEELTDDEELLLADAQESMRKAFEPFSKALAKQFQGLGILGGDGRTRAEYVEEVEEHLRRCRAALPGSLMAAVIESREAEISLALRNDTDSNIPAVELELYVEGRVLAAEDSEDFDGDMPAPPRRWGTSSWQTSLIMPSFSRLNYPAAFSGMKIPGLQIDNEASARITFPPVDLRPLSRVELPPVHLLVGPAHAGQQLTATWRATSSGMDGVATGALRIDVGTVGKRPIPEVLLSDARKDGDEADD